MVKNLENNLFIRETLNGSKSEKNCVLVKGLNLSGDKKAAKNEKIVEHFCIVPVIRISREVLMYVIQFIT